MTPGQRPPSLAAAAVSTDSAGTIEQVRRDISAGPTVASTLHSCDLKCDILMLCYLQYGAQ
jgi:hypothetical protein